MAELEKVNSQLENVDGSAQIEDVYRQVRGYVVHAQQKVYKAVNSAMVGAYWQIGKLSTKHVVRTIVQPMANRC